MMQFNKIKWKRRLLISVATEGWVRYEWAHARFGQIMPVNWEASGFDVGYAAMGYSIDDAYNLITKKALDMGVEWLLIIEDDTLIPHDCFIKMGEYMQANTHPVVSGLYYTKSEPAVPLLFRGRGNGAFLDWKMGDKVMVDGLPMGCLLIHTDLLKVMWNTCPEYHASDGEKLHKVFETPRITHFDPEKGIQRQEGTQDLYFFDRLIEQDVIGQVGRWPDIAKLDYPLLCDTSIFCRHIDRATGKQYPS